MKVSASYLESMKSEIERVINANGGWEKCVELYENGKFPRSDKVKDLNKRFRWDLLYAAKCYDKIIKPLYDEEGCDDTHIDTALRRIVPSIERKY